RSARHLAQPADRDHRRRRHAGEGVYGQRLVTGTGPRGSSGTADWAGTGDCGLGTGDGADDLRAQGFTPRERRLVARLRTPLAVQKYLNQLPYNQEPGGRATLRSFRGVVRNGCAHCLEAALFAAVVLETHGYPPLVLSFESIDELDHVMFAYQRDRRWGSIARSRDPGLHGRKAVFTTPRALALSYF